MEGGDTQPFLKKKFREELKDDDEGISPYKKRTWTKYIYSPEQNIFCGRTPKRWGQLLLAYLILYGILALWISLLWAVFYINISNELPRWFAHQPGLSVIPCDPDFGVAKYCPFLRKKKEALPYIKQNLAVLRKYGDVDNPPRNFGPCTRLEKFGYMDKPCFFLKINKVVGFEPEVYKSAAELPEYAPQELKTFVQKLSGVERSNRIWLSCEPADIEAHKSVGIHFYPERFVNASLLVYKRKFEKNAADYKHVNKTVRRKEYEGDRKYYTAEDFGRMVAVQFTNLPKNENVRINCFMWAKNILITKFHETGLGKVVIVISTKEDRYDEA